LLGRNRATQTITATSPAFGEGPGPTRPPSYILKAPKAIPTMADNSTPEAQALPKQRRDSVRQTSPSPATGTARHEVQKAQLQSVPLTNMVTNNVNRTALHPGGVQ
jgi:hypothetical protein